MRLILFFLIFSISATAQKVYEKLYYDSGSVKAEGWIKSHQKNGYWKHYYANGNIKKEGHYLEGKQNKYWYFYHPNKNIQKEGHFKVNSKENWWLFYNKNGKIEHKAQFKNNVKNGLCLCFYNAEIFRAEKYVDGQKIKEWTDTDTFLKENKLSIFQW